jgi:hypothetical protein
MKKPGNTGSNPETTTTGRQALCVHLCALVPVTYTSPEKPSRLTYEPIPDNTVRRIRVGCSTARCRGCEDRRFGVGESRPASPRALALTGSSRDLRALPQNVPTLRRRRACLPRAQGLCQRPQPA